MKWGASTQRSPQQWPIRRVLLYRKRYDQNEIALDYFSRTGLWVLCSALIRCARTGDLVLLNDVLALGDIEADYKTPEVRPWYLVLQSKSLCYICLRKEGGLPGEIDSGWSMVEVRLAAVQGDTPLYFAARHGHLEIVQALLAHGADVAMRCSKV